MSEQGSQVAAPFAGLPSGTQLSAICASNAVVAHAPEPELAPEGAITVAATFTAEPIAEPLEFWMTKLGISAKVRFAAYNQVFQHLLGLGVSVPPGGSCARVILLRLEDWEGKQDKAASERIQNVEHTADEFFYAVRTAVSRSSMPHLICFCPPSKAALDRFREECPLERIEQRLASRLDEVPQVEVITSSRLFDLYPVPDYEDEYASKIAHIPYTPLFFVALATMLARRMYSLRHAPRKVIAVDCDYTLWDGVCAEDGATGVTVDAPRRIFQDFLIDQHDAGMLLCTASKNAEEDVGAVFAANPGMRLRAEHIISSRINWRPKPDNLRELADELNLGLDSFLFIDDNPLECAEVRAACPQVLVVELPADAARIPAFVRHFWAFDHWKLTKEDTRRNALYRQERARDELREKAASLEDFLARLDLKIDIRSAATEDLARLSQLTERTSQFNFTGIRRSAGDIEKLLQAGLICLGVEAADRFGDYGLVGFVIATKQAQCLAVDTFLLSCRALGRAVEHRMLARLGSIALEHGLQEVEVPFATTSRNQPARDFLESLHACREDSDANRGLYCFRASALPAIAAMNGHAAIEASSPPPLAATEKPVARDVLAEIADRLATVEEIAYAIESHNMPGTPSAAGYPAPRTLVEEVLGGIWSALLRIERPGVYDDFFSLGGNSLLAAQMLARVRRMLETELPLRAVFEAPTIAELGARIEAARGGALSRRLGESCSEGQSAQSDTRRDRSGTAPLGTRVLSEGRHSESEESRA